MNHNIWLSSNIFVINGVVLKTTYGVLMLRHASERSELIACEIILLYIKLS